MSDCERIAQVTHVKQATVSKSLRSLMINEQMSKLKLLTFIEQIAQSRFCSPKMREWANRLVFFEWIATLGETLPDSIGRGGNKQKVPQDLEPGQSSLHSSFFCGYIWGDIARFVLGGSNRVGNLLFSFSCKSLVCCPKRTNCLLTILIEWIALFALFKRANCSFPSFGKERQSDSLFLLFLKDWPKRAICSFTLYLKSEKIDPLF